MKIYIEVDTNDGDYVGDLKGISVSELSRFKEIAEKVGDGFANWAEGDCAETTPEDAYPQLNGEEIEFIGDFMPYCEYGFHTVEKIITLEEKEVLA